MDELINKAHSNTGKPVIILGHSYGGHLVHRYVSQTRLAGLIHSQILVAPSWGGASVNLVALWRKRVATPIPFGSKERMANFVGSIPGFYLHLPHAGIFARKTVIYGPNGDRISGANVLEALLDHKRVSHRNYMIQELAGIPDLLKDFPPSPQIRTRILYNSGIKTPFGLNLTKWDSDGEIVYDKRGDGTVVAEGIEWACDNWRGENLDVECVDLESSDGECHHTKLLSSKRGSKLLLKWLVGDDLGEFEEQIDEL
jgi:hypothetical protein